MAAERALPIEWAEEIQPQLSSLWLIKRFLPQQGLALLFGHPGTGKSFLALDLAMHVAAGRAWFGRPTRQGTVVYVAAEGQAGLRNRIAAFKSFYDLDEKIPLGLVPASVNLFDCETDLRGLAKAVRLSSERYDAAPMLIVIDTISKTLGNGKENTDDLAAYVGNCGQLASEFSCCVLQVHHRPKSSEGADPRGHGSLLAGVDTALLVTAQTRARRVELTKQKDGEPVDPISFQLQSVVLGTDEDGELVTSCVVVPAAVSKARQASSASTTMHQLPEQPRWILECLIELLGELGAFVHPNIPGNELDRTVTKKTATVAHWKQLVMSTGRTNADKKRDTQRKAFERAVNTLKTRRLISVWHKWVWLAPELEQELRTLPDSDSGQPCRAQDITDLGL